MQQRASIAYRRLQRQEPAGGCSPRGRCGRGSYPLRSPLRRGFDAGCSISQNIQTNAVPRATTTIKNINVNAGAVSMFNINTGASLFIRGQTGSVADLHGPNAPTIRCQHALPHNVAAAIAVVIGIVIAAVVRIAVIIVVVIAVRSIEAVP